MKSAGVFLGGLGGVLACNLMLVGVCSSAPGAPAPAVPAPLPPAPAPIVKTIPKPAQTVAPSAPLGVFFWGCGAHLSVDPEGALPLPICAPLRRL